MRGVALLQKLRPVLLNNVMSYYEKPTTHKLCVLVKYQIAWLQIASKDVNNWLKTNYFD